MNKRAPKIGLALSGGTLKGAAHIGVIAALEQIGVEPDVIAGTSAGSLVSALYAHGYRQQQFNQLIQSFPGTKIIDYGFPLWSTMLSLTKHTLKIQSSNVPDVPSGLIRGRKFIKYIERLLANRKLQIPLYIVATDLITGRPVVFGSTEIKNLKNAVDLVDIPKVIAGSCALPGIFTPVAIDDYVLVDGAMRDYVPINVLKDLQCDKIIAVNLYRIPDNFHPVTLVDVLARSFDILLRESIDQDLVAGPTTYVLEPDVSTIKWRRFSQMNDCVEKGRLLVNSQKNEILQFVRA